MVIHSLSFVFQHISLSSIPLNDPFAFAFCTPFSAVVTDGKGDYLLAFKGHEGEENAGVSTRSFGDHFTATAQIFNGALIHCLPITDLARMVTNLVNGVSGLCISISLLASSWSCFDINFSILTFVFALNDTLPSPSFLFEFEGVDPSCYDE
jgi:hypothetical protein